MFKINIRTILTVSVVFSSALLTVLMGWSLDAAHAQSRATWFQDLEITPQVLEQRATQLFQFYDPDGMVWVYSEARPLPARPDSREQILEALEVVTSKKDRFKVMVFTTLPKVPPEFLKTLRSAMGAEVDVSKVIPVPSKMAAEVLAQRQAEAQNLAENKDNRSLASNSDGTSKVVPQELAVSALDQLLSSRLLTFFVLMIALAMAGAVVWVLHKMVASLKEIPNVLREKLTRERDSEPEVSSVAKFQEMQALQSQSLRQNQRDFDLDLDATLGLFCDLIHAQRFDELHYYWEQTPFSQKRDILLKMPSHKSVLSKLQQYGLKASQLHQDPAYLTLTLAELDMTPENLVKKIKVYPEWILKTSALQRENLALPILEKLGIYENYPDFISETKLRVSKDDEKELLKRPGVKPFWVKSCPSMIWLKLLGADVAQKILAQYNATDLSKVWDVPEEFKQELEKWVPTDKLELIQFYGDKKGYQRDQAVLEHIHGKIIEAFEEKQAKASSKNGGAKAA